MSLKIKAISLIKNNREFFLVYAPCALLIFISGALLLVYPFAAAEGVKNGIKLCLDTIVPSLFPFLLISSVICESGIFNISGPKLNKLTNKLFALPCESLYIIAMSLIGGYPVGANLITGGLNKKILSPSQARRLLLFCVNPGPAFTVSAIGASLLGSRQAGLLVYIASATASLTLGIISRFFVNEKADGSFKTEPRITFPEASALTRSVSTSVKSTVTICVWVVIFSCIDGLMEKLIANQTVLSFCKMLFEVTTGAVFAAENFSLPIISAVVSFGGICVHFQLMSAIVRLRLKYIYFLAVRIVSSALACFYTAVIIKLFPQYVSVAAVGIKPQAASTGLPASLCSWLMLLCGLFIIGDSYVIRLDKKKV